VTTIDFERKPDGTVERPERLVLAATVRDVSMPERATNGRQHGTRVRGTRQAEAVAAVLDGLPGFCSAQQIHAELRRRGEQVGLTTVYRHLQALSESGRIDAIRDSSGEILYRRCQTDTHHHHLTCRSCGRSVEVEGRAVEMWAEQVALQAGFTSVGHTVELFGLCPDCGATARPRT
jgi:Fur family ferric uptake transcriptional regulator